MPAGRPPKSIAEHVAQGTYRKDRHDVDIVPAPQAQNTSPPSPLPVSLVPAWDTVVSDLLAVGIVTKTDILLLSQAFKDLENAELIQLAYDEALRGDGEGTNTSDISKLQSARASAMSSYSKILEGIRRTVKGNPKPRETDWLKKI